jgi:transposase-like protein
MVKIAKPARDDLRQIHEYIAKDSRYYAQEVVQAILNEISKVEKTLNAMLDAEADAICNAQRYERSPGRQDTRAGHYTRKLHTKAGEVALKV